MNAQKVSARRSGAGVLAVLLLVVLPVGGASAQSVDAEKISEAERRAEAALARPDSRAASAAPAPAAVQPTEQINALVLYRQGGVLMYPITFMSFLVVVFGLERLIGLRRGRVIPKKFLAELGALIAEPGAFDPRKAYQLCQQYPSAAANVVRAVLLKVGRPASELEHAVAEANEREANRLYRNVRWLDLSASITPLMGLLGTVQGMILAFFITAHLPLGANRAESLAQGIYVALVTTFGGLVVAIPAAILAHFYEGRIQSLFAELDEPLMNLIPKLERFEGRVRVRREPPAPPPIVEK